MKHTHEAETVNIYCCLQPIMLISAAGILQWLRIGYYEYQSSALKVMSGGWKQICPGEPKLVRFLAQYEHVNRKLYYFEN